MTTSPETRCQLSGPGAATYSHGPGCIATYRQNGIQCFRHHPVQIGYQSLHLLLLVACLHALGGLSRQRRRQSRIIHGRLTFVLISFKDKFLQFWPRHVRRTCMAAVVNQRLTQVSIAICKNSLRTVPSKK